jgi:hypothetical protein
LAFGFVLVAKVVLVTSGPTQRVFEALTLTVL